MAVLYYPGPRMKYFFRRGLGKLASGEGSGGNRRFPPGTLLLFFCFFQTMFTLFDLQDLWSTLRWTITRVSFQGGNTLPAGCV